MTIDTTYHYDPDLPYVLVNRQTGEVMGRAVRKGIAESLAAGLTVDIIDTTPAPRVPEDARIITWKDSGYRRYAERLPDGKWEDYGGTVVGVVSSLPGVTPETRFTVLEERKS